MLKELAFVSMTAILATTGSGSEPLIRAIEANDSAAVARLVTDKDAISEVHEQHGTALIFAVRLDRREFVKQLIAAGADVDQTVTKHGWFCCRVGFVARRPRKNLDQLN